MSGLWDAPAAGAATTAGAATAAREVTHA
jgi:hypothetical protein